MICGRCGMWYSTGDNYCRRCGASVGSDLPAVPAERSLARLSQAVPPVVWKGLAAVAATKVLEWGARAAVRRVVEAAPVALNALVRGRDAGATRRLSPANHTSLTNGAAGPVAETIILLRRIRIIHRAGSDG